MRPLPLLVALVMLSCGPVAEPSPTPPPPTETPTASPPSPTPEPTATPDPTPQPGVRATALGQLPRSFRYVETAWPLGPEEVSVRLWLVDLDTAGAPARQAAEWVSASTSFSASADGRSVVLEGIAPSGLPAIYLLRPETGEASVVFEEEGSRPVAPTVTHDGSRIAFGKRPLTGIGGDLGIWAGPIGGPYALIAAASELSNVPATPLGWSPTGEWLAFARRTARDEVRLVRSGGGPEVTVGEGRSISWRTQGPELLVGAGDRMYTYGITTARTQDVHGDARGPFFDVHWHVALERFVYATSGTHPGGVEIWIRNADGSQPARVDGERWVLAPRWSPDGTLLTALVGGDDSVVPIIDLATGREIAHVCRRGGAPGRCL